MESQCGSAAICFVSFLPDILDSKAEGRNKYLTTLRNVAEKYKRSAYRQVMGQNLLNLHKRNPICLFLSLFLFFDLKVTYTSEPLSVSKQNKKQNVNPALSTFT